MMSKLKSYGIVTRPFFWPLNKQTKLIHSNFLKNELHSVAENISYNGFDISSGLGINEDEINRVSEGVKRVLLSVPRR